MNIWTTPGGLAGDFYRDTPTVLLQFHQGAPKPSFDDADSAILRQWIRNANMERTDPADDVFNDLAEIVSSKLDASLDPP